MWFLKTLPTLSVLAILVCRVRSSQENSTSTTAKPRSSGETVHLYLLEISESSIAKIRNPYRQDEDDPPTMTFAQTGQNLGKIISGVLGGDIRPIFAGSLGFVEEPMAQTNLGSFFGTIAPALNLALREVYTRVKTRAQNTFGFGTPSPTPAAAVPTKRQQQQPIYEYEDPIITGPIITPKPAGINNGISSAQTVGGTGNQQTLMLNPQLQEQALLQQYASLLAEQQLIEQQLLFLQQQQQLQAQNIPPVSTTSWQYVMNQLHSPTTTVEPLPLIRYRTTTPTPTVAATSSVDEDGDYESRFE